MGGTYQLSWLYKRNKWVFNPAQKEFKSGESLRERGNGFQTEGAADMKLLRPYRLNFIFGTQVIRVGATQSSGREVPSDQLTKVARGTTIDTAIGKDSNFILDTGADRKPVQRFQ